MIPITLVFMEFAFSKIDRVSSVLPEYEEHIIKVELSTHEGRLYPLITIKGILISSLINEFTTSPPMADPPIPATMTLFTFS